MTALVAVIATLIIIFFIGVVVLSVVEYKRSKRADDDVRQQPK